MSSKSPNNVNGSSSEKNTMIKSENTHTFSTYPNDLIGVGILSLGNRQTGKWIPQGFWYSSKTFGQNKVFCILCKGTTDRSRHVPLSTLQMSNSVKSLRLTRVKVIDDENSLRNLIYSTTSLDSEISSSKFISTILTKFQICKVRSKKARQPHSTELVLDQIDKNIQKIRDHVKNLNEKSASPPEPEDQPDDFSITAEIEPSTLLDVEHFEKKFFEEIYTFFK